MAVVVVVVVVVVAVSGDDGSRTTSPATACQCRLQGFFATRRGFVALARHDTNVDSCRLVCSSGRAVDGCLQPQQHQRRRLSSSQRQSPLPFLVGGGRSQRTVQVLSVSLLVACVASLASRRRVVLLHAASCCCCLSLVCLLISYSMCRHVPANNDLIRPQ